MILYFKVRRMCEDDFLMFDFYSRMSELYNRASWQMIREAFDHAQGLLVAVAVVIPILFRRLGLSISGWLAAAGRSRRR